MRNFRKYEIWQDSMHLVYDVFEILSSVKDPRARELLHQIRKSAVSIPSNIAEGSGRKSSRDFARFLHIAAGSTFELETQLLILEHCFCRVKPEVLIQLNQVQKQLGGFIRAIDSK